MTSGAVLKRKRHGPGMEVESLHKNLTLPGGVDSILGAESQQTKKLH